jgi:hypothetical protein
LSSGTPFATVEPGTYTVSAVNRLANESAGVGKWSELRLRSYHII